MKNSNPHETTVRRAALPEVMLVGDVALALDLPELDAQRLLSSGRLGLAFEVEGRLAVLRSSFLTALEGGATPPSGHGAEGGGAQ